MSISTNSSVLKSIARTVMLLVCLSLWTTTNAQNYLLQKLPLFPDKQDILIHGLTKDRLGFIWFLHNSEIYRFDGYRSLNVSKTILSNDSLNDPPQKILVDKQNRLWIAGQEQVRYLDLTTWEIHPMNEQILPELNDRTIAWMKEMDDGAIIIAYQNGHLVLNKNNEWLLITSLYKRSLKANIPIHAQSCTIWKGKYRIGTSAGSLLSIDPTNGNTATFQELAPTQYSILNLIALDNRLVIDVSNQGLLALHENGQLIPEKIAGMQFKPNAKHIFQDSPHRHVYADAEHIYILDKTLKVVQEINIAVSQQYALIDENEIVLGADDGIHILFEKPAGLSELVNCNSGRRKSVRGIYAFKDGGIFFGSYGGAGYIDVSGRCHAVDSIKNVYSMLPLNDSELVIGTEGGFLKIFNRHTLTFRDFSYTVSHQIGNQIYSFPSRVLSLSQTAQHYWIGSTKGLWILDKATHLLSPINIQLDGQTLVDLQIRHILDLGAVKLLSTQLGLLKVEKEGEAKKLYPEQGSIGVYKTILSEDTLWLATQGKGLVALDKNGSLLKSWTQSDGLSANTIFSLEIADDFKLAGTADGLSLLKNGVIKRIGEKEGLIHPEFNSGASFWDKTRGKVFMGGIKGYTVLETSKLQIQSTPAQSYVTEVHIASSSSPFIKKDFTRPYVEKGMIELKADESIVGLYIGTPAYNRSSVNVDYSIQESGWQTLQPGQFISLISPSPGSYPIQFETFGSGLEVGTSTIWVQKLPYFYETWWFTFLLILLAITIVAIWYRSKFLKIEREQQIRNRIAEDLHDEVGGLLTGISMQVELLRMKNEFVANQRNILQLSILSKEVLQSMNDVVWSLNSRNDTWKNLLDKLTDFGRNLFEASGAQFSIIIVGTIPDRLSQQERQTVYLLIRESLNNACKHANATEVVLAFYFNKQINITVTDNGCGFASGNRYHGNGIKNMKKRSLAISGDLEIQSDSTGTTIRLQYTPK